MFGFKPEIRTSVEMIGRDEGIFVKTMFWFKKSYVKVLHKQKNAHKERHVSKVNALIVHLLMSLMIRTFLSYEINFRGTS